MKKAVKMWLRIGGRMSRWWWGGPAQPGPRRVERRPPFAFAATAVDAAQNYLNEDEIGDGLAESIAEGVVKRGDVFLSSKLNNPYHRYGRPTPSSFLPTHTRARKPCFTGAPLGSPEHVRPALEKTLLDLRVDQLGSCCDSGLLQLGRR
jgi:hypothetical protein